MSRTTAGRKSWETRVNFGKDVENFAHALASKEWKYDEKTTKAMSITRTVTETGKAETINFSIAYDELSIWFDYHRARLNVKQNDSLTRIGVLFEQSELGFSDLLCELLLNGAEIVTPKATYKLWVAPVKEEKSEPLMIPLSARRGEFIKALERAEQSKLEVFANFERDSFTVINSEKANEYEVRFLTRDGETFASCACADFVHRQRICKHISEVIWFAFGGLIGRVEEFTKPFSAVTFATNFKDGAEPVTRRFRTQKEAVQSVERSAEIAGSCFQYGRVFNRDGAEVYTIEVADFEEAFTYDFDCQYLWK